MSRALLLSVKPKYVAEILNGTKTLEIRKTMPKCDLPIDVYIYCTKDKKSGLHYSKEYGAFNDLVGGMEHYSTIGDGCGKAVAKFTLNKVEYFEREYSSRYIDDFYGNNGEPLNKNFYKSARITENELFEYIGSKGGYAWHISNLVIFDKPKELSEFRVFPEIKKIETEEDFYNFTYGKPLKKAPQSWGYCTYVGEQ